MIIYRDQETVYSADGVPLTVVVKPNVHEPEPVVLRCGCCGLPWARLENGALVVESRHSGQVHVNRLSVEALAALVAGNGATGATNGEAWGYGG